MLIIPKISVIIPAYNAEAFLTQGVESIISQSYQDWELIIVDDGSTDSTLSIATEFSKRDPRIRAIHQSNAGVADARNNGFTKTSDDTPYVLFLDADDVLMPDAFTVLLDGFHANPKADVVYGHAQNINSAGESIGGNSASVWSNNRRALINKRPVKWPIDAPTTFNVLAFANCIVTPGTVLIKRSALIKAGPFDNTAVPSEDWDMWLRLSLQNDLIDLKHIVLKYRVHSNSQSKNPERMRQAARAIVTKWRAAEQNTQEQGQLVYLGWRYGEKHFAGVRLGWAWYRLKKGHLKYVFLEILRAGRCFWHFLTGRF